MGGVRIGRIFGIELRVDLSWVLVFLLVAWSLTALFIQWHPAWSATTSVVVAGAAALLFFASVLFHELAHSLVARGYGLPVRDITLFLFGGVSSIEREPRTPGSEALIALVGPLASFGLGILAIVLASVSVAITGLDVRAEDAASIVAGLGPVETLLFWLGPVNLGVGLFNLIPGYPLDGGRVLHAAIWKVTGDPHRATRTAAIVGQVVGLGFAVAGVFMALGLRVPLLGTGLASGLWLVLIGLFLRGAAARSQAGAAIREALAGLRVADLMRTHFAWVDAHMPLRVLVESWFLRREERAFPVFEDEIMVGLVCLDDVRRLEPSRWDGAVAGDVMTPAARLVVADPEEPLVDALGKLAQGGVGQLPVVRAGRVVGVLYDRDVARWIELESGTRRAPDRVRHA